MAKNVFKYRCDDCGEEQMRAKLEFSRRTRPRCTACGSTWLEPVTSEAANRIVDGADAYRGDKVKTKRKMGGFK